MPGSCTTFDLFLFKLHREVSETMIMCAIDPVIVVDYIARYIIFYWLKIGVMQTGCSGEQHRAWDALTVKS